MSPYTLIKVVVGQFLIASFSLSLNAQMHFNGEDMYGNEWIDYSKSYLKCTVSEDDVYRIYYRDLVQSGFPAGLQGNEIQLFSFGIQTPIFVSNEGPMSDEDYIEFFGRKNDGSLDKVLFSDWEKQQLNPKYSLFSDERSYFITWDNSNSTDFIFQEVDGEIPTVETEPYYMETEEVVLHQTNNKHQFNTFLVRYSQFYLTEGFGSKPDRINEFDLDINNIADVEVSSKLNFRLSLDYHSHILRMWFNDILLDNTALDGYSVEEFTYEIPKDKIDSKNTLSIFSNASNNDKASVAYATLSYPREFVANGKDMFRFKLDQHSNEKRIEVQNLDADIDSYRVIDLKNNEFITLDKKEDTRSFGLSSVNNDRDIVIYSSGKLITELENIEFNSFENQNPDYVILTSKALDSSDDAGNNWVKEYRDFREDEQNGGYNVLIVHYEDLRDQFGFGMENHPVAIRNWTHYQQQNWPDWEFTFIIGKAYEYPDLRKNPNLVCHVPTYGHPGSDNLLFADYGDALSSLAVGRLAAKTKEDIKNYLHKVTSAQNAMKAEQTIESKSWMKKIIHMSGGGSAIQSKLFSTYLEEMGNEIEANKFGADISRYEKNSTDPIENSVTESIINEINNGASFITFFGHASVGSFDYSIEDPSLWDNEGKLPFIYSLGCHSGNIHTTYDGISEEFVMFPEKGSLGFYASSSTAFINPQFFHGLGMYEEMGGDYYGVPMAKTIQKVISEHYVDTLGQKIPIDEYFEPINTSIVTLSEQLTLHGDPALVVYQHQGPDFIVDKRSVKNKPEVLTTNLDYFNLEFDIFNIGHVITDSIEIEIIHTYSELQDTFYQKIKTPIHSDTYIQKIPLAGLLSEGANQIEITLDPDNKINEFPGPGAEQNNRLSSQFNNDGYTFHVSSFTPIPYYPSDYGITNDSQVILKASTGNAFSKQQEYTLQIDTTFEFNSPSLFEEIVESDGGLIQWNPEIEFEDETVYYWSIRNMNIDSVINYNSFLYSEEYEYGWNQSHYYQLGDNEYENVFLDSITRNVHFARNLTELRITNPPRITRDDFVEVNSNGSFIAGGYNVDSIGMMVIVFDGITGELVPCPGNGTHGADNRVVAEEQNFWVFRLNKFQDRNEFLNFIQNEVSDNSHIILIANEIHNSNYLSPHLWEEGIWNELESQGATAAKGLIEKVRPYVFAYQKNVGATLEQISPIQTEEDLSSSIILDGSWYTGNFKSTKVGPAKKWDKFIIDLDNFEINSDNWSIDIIGIDHEENENVLIEESNEREIDLKNIDPQKYPYLKIKSQLDDPDNRTAPALDYWRVVFEEYPDIFIHQGDNYMFHADTIAQGDSISLEFLVETNKKLEADSIEISYFLKNNQNDKVYEHSEKIKLGVEDPTTYSINLNTDELKGLYELVIEVNSNKVIYEENIINNIGRLGILVQHDEINPILDVTFDNQRIMNGDIVSPNSRIKVCMIDNNERFPIDDVSYFDLAIQLPDGQSFVIENDDPNLTFLALEESDGACIEYESEFSEGLHTLYAQGRDATGNFSGEQPYRMNFEVITEEMISDVLAYPNPFSDQTQFIFTLTGNQIPEDYNIKIFTLSGKVVKEIRKEELGPIHIGINRTDYRWDGTDDYGSTLGNGVYIYKLYTTMDEQLDEYEISGLSDFFKKGFGKVVIMR